eukprot:NODE_2229_length_1107_cov_64.354082_g2211_i0.p1 GENE.NODE_2229_length_1107_cov_64.354082_g2211_i0~~NODE_2229_length_1107_cov_64.354082_g2211_i0.p1  ORF type:complete len:324 (+),score=-8.17 NODE_2229_length_1107_cov_64.354082_g2211_i0:71-1042(+)
MLTTQGYVNTPIMFNGTLPLLAQPTSSRAPSSLNRTMPLSARPVSELGDVFLLAKLRASTVHAAPARPHRNHHHRHAPRSQAHLTPLQRSPVAPGSEKPRTYQRSAYAAMAAAPAAPEPQRRHRARRRKPPSESGMDDHTRAMLADSEIVYMTPLQKRRLSAVHVLQRTWRCHYARWQRSARHQARERRYAATEAAQDLAVLGRKYGPYVRTLQCWWRSWLARQNAQRRRFLRDTYITARQQREFWKYCRVDLGDTFATTIQCAWRTYRAHQALLARWEARQLTYVRTEHEQHRQWAAIRIQAVWRGSYARATMAEQWDAESL